MVTGVEHSKELFTGTETEKKIFILVTGVEHSKELFTGTKTEKKLFVIFGVCHSI